MTKNISTRATEITASVNGIEVEMNGRVFSTGSDGYHYSGKMSINGAMYQVNLLATRIGSKKEA
jgi:hypothetical protein